MQSIGHCAVSIDSSEDFIGINIFAVVSHSVEEVIDGNILGERRGLEMGAESATSMLDS